MLVDNNNILLEDKNIEILKKMVRQLELDSNKVYATFLNSDGAFFKLYKQLKKDDELKNLTYYKDFFSTSSFFKKEDAGIVDICFTILKTFSISSRLLQKNYKRIIDDVNNADYDNLNLFLRFHKISITFLKIAYFIVSNRLARNYSMQTGNTTRNISRTDNIEKFFESFIRYKQPFNILYGLLSKRLDSGNIENSEIQVNKLYNHIFKNNPQFKGFLDKSNIKKAEDFDIENLGNISGNTRFSKLILNYIKLHRKIDSIIQNRIKQTTLQDYDEDDTKNKSSASKKTKKNKTNKKITKQQSRELKQIISDFYKGIENLNLNDSEIEQAIKDFVERNKQLLLNSFYHEFSENASLLSESLPQIRWRKNARLGLNKIVLTCKKDEYKKSLNRDITLSGKKVKDVICLPKSTKPATQRIKDRRTSLKRWKSTNKSNKK